jgi:hypothetical protein
MILAFILGVTATAASIPFQESNAEPDPLQQALECRVYSDMAKGVFADKPGPRAANEKLHRYWLKRSEDLGAKAGISQQGVMMKSLVIRLEADRFTPVMTKCFDLTPKAILD